MNPRTNLKLLLSLFAVLALNHAYLHGDEAQSEDFASTSSSNSDLESQFDTQIQTSNQTLSLEHDSGKVKTTVNVNRDEGTFTLTIDCDSCGITTDPVKESINMKNFKDIASLDKQFASLVAKANKTATKSFNQKVKQAKDVKDCNTKEDSKTLQTKLACFKKQEASITDDDKKQDYEKNVVDKYLKDNVLNVAEKELSMTGNQFAQLQAQGQIAQLVKAGVGSSDLTSQMKFMDEVAATNLLPMQLNQQIQQLQMQSLQQRFQAYQQLQSANGAVSQAQMAVSTAQQAVRAAGKNAAQAQMAQAQLKQAQAQLASAQQSQKTLTAQQQNYSQALNSQITNLNMNYTNMMMSNRMTLDADMANVGNGSMDPQLYTAAQLAINGSGSNIQGIINGNPSMKAAFGNSLSFLAPQPLTGMPSLGFGATTPFQNDPWNASIASEMSAINAGAMTDSGTGTTWTNFPSTGTNLSDPLNSLVNPGTMLMMPQVPSVAGQSAQLD